MPNKKIEILNTTVAMTTALQTPNTAKILIPNYGDVQELQCVITASCTGTLSALKKVANAVKYWNILANDKSPIWNNLEGLDLGRLHASRSRINGGVGKIVTETDIANAANTDSFVIPWRIDQEQQDATLQLTINSYSDMATGATGGTVTISVFAVYSNDSGPKYTEVLDIIAPALASGSAGNVYKTSIPDKKYITNTYFKIGTESNLTDISFSANGNVELQKLSVNEMIAEDNRDYASGHKTGLFDLRHSAYVKDTTTQLFAAGAGSDTLTFYFVSVISNKN